MLSPFGNAFWDGRWLFPTLGFCQEGRGESPPPDGLLPHAGLNAPHPLCRIPCTKGVRCLFPLHSRIILMGRSWREQPIEVVMHLR